MRLGKIIAFLVLLLIGLTALGMTVCGGGVLVIFIGSHGWRNGGTAVAAMAIASAVIGLTVLWAVWKGMKAFGQRD